MFALGVFCTFAGLSILLDVPHTVHPPLGWFALYVTISGLVAVTYAFAFLRDWRLVPVGLALQNLVFWLDGWARAPGRGFVLSAAAESRRLTIDAIVCFVGVGFGYAFLMRSIHGLARGHAVLHTEIELARGIHDALAPPVAGRTGRIEYYGRTQPSGTIGGDLVDAVAGRDGLVLYVVDVSGHGIRAAVLMAMLKSTARTALAGGADLPAMLAHFNRTICELDRPAIFATCAALAFDRSGTVHYALAGHPPMLLRRASGEVSELAEGSPPLGLNPAAAYASTPVELAAGDALLVVTDGLTEVFGSDSRELGIEGVREAASAARYGRQLDDQTALAVRMVG
jgi:hypothetical protein